MRKEQDFEHRVYLELDTDKQVMRVFDTQLVSGALATRYWKWDGSGSNLQVSQGTLENIKNTQACEIPLHSLELLYKVLRNYFGHVPENTSPVETETTPDLGPIQYWQGQVRALHDVIEVLINGKQ